MQQNAAFSNQLEERSPTWPSQRHGKSETKQEWLAMMVSWLPDVTFTSWPSFRF
jgi:hypothetical protein